MSRIGNAIITMPQGVQLETTDTFIRVRGPKGELTVSLPGGITMSQEGQEIKIASTLRTTSGKALHGLVRASLANAMTGVTTGWTKMLELSGVGYRAALSGANLQLSVGFSHAITVVPPTGITFQITEGKIVVAGFDKQLVGETAAQIRRHKEPEPYKGKGIKYVGEVIRKKAGKAAKAVGGAK